MAAAVFAQQGFGHCLAVAPFMKQGSGEIHAYRAAVIRKSNDDQLWRLVSLHHPV